MRAERFLGLSENPPILPFLIHLLLAAGCVSGRGAGDLVLGPVLEPILIGLGAGPLRRVRRRL